MVWVPFSKSFLAEKSEKLLPFLRRARERPRRPKPPLGRELLADPLPS
jgi:hypothetical protein